MKLFQFFISTIVLALCAGSAQASAQTMLIGGRTTQPIGHYEFCKKVPKECNVTSKSRNPLDLNDKWRKLLSSVTAKVNRAVGPKSDLETWGKDEVWSFPNRTGDCEDYVLEKRRILKEAGIPVGNLLITVVRKPDGEGHAVLTVVTDKGDLILDNSTDKVLSWTETGYKYIKRQSETHTGQWVSIRNGSSHLHVASVD